MSRRHANSSSADVAVLVLLVLGLAIVTWWLVGLVARTLVLTLVATCRLAGWCVCRMRAPHEREHAIMRRRLQFDEPIPLRARSGKFAGSRRATSHALPSGVSVTDPDEVRQIMAQLGRRDAAGRAMAERILAAGGPRRPL